MSPRTPSQLEQVRAKSRTKIMHAAIELFAKKVYHSTSISQIAQKAHISKGAMYTYFKSKQHLLDEILLSSFMEAASPVEAITAPGEPVDKLRMMVEASFTMVEQNRHQWELLFSIMTQYEVIPRIKKTFSKMLLEYISIFEMLFKEMGLPKPRIEAYKLGAMIDGVMLDYLYLLPKDYPLHEMKEEIISPYEKYRKK